LGAAASSHLTNIFDSATQQAPTYSKPTRLFLVLCRRLCSERSHFWGICQSASCPSVEGSLVLFGHDLRSPAHIFGDFTGIFFGHHPSFVAESISWIGHHPLLHHPLRQVNCLNVDRRTLVIPTFRTCLPADFVFSAFRPPSSASCLVSSHVPYQGFFL
jgi:hypothetical protein